MPLMDGLTQFKMKKIINILIIIFILLPWPLIYAELCERGYAVFMLEYFTIGMQIQGTIYIFAFIGFIARIITKKKDIGL